MGILFENTEWYIQMFYVSGGNSVTQSESSSSEDLSGDKTVHSNKSVIKKFQVK